MLLAIGWTKMCEKTLTALCAVGLLLAVVVLVFTTTVVPFMARGDVYILTTRHNPNGDAAYQQLRTYAELHGWTERFMHQRNRYVLRFHYAVGLSFVAGGVLLTTWTVDRHRLHGRIRELESSRGG